MRKLSFRTHASVICLGLSTAGIVPCAMAQDGTAQETPVADTDAIVVTGRRAALQSADDRKKNAISIVDSVVADDAGKLPDNSITEVLQRVPGVTIVRFQSLNDPDHYSAEGSGIQIRGLSGVASRLNGRDIFSANGGRSLQFSDVTPELMQAVDVYKSSTADQIEGGTGGSVDLRTKLPFDYGYGLHFAGTADVSMGDLSQKTDYSASGLVAGKFDTGIGDLGFVFDYAHSQLSTKSQFVRMEEFYRTNIQGNDYFIPGGYTYGEENYQRKRDGIYGAVQWAPTPELTLTGIYFQSKYSNTDSEYGSFVTSQNLAVDPSQSVFDDNGGLISSPAVFQRDAATGLPTGAAISSGGTSAYWEGKNKTEDISGSLTWAPTSLPIVVQASYQHTKSTATVDRISVFRTVDFPTSYGLDLSGSLPQISVPAGTQAALLDPANYAWQAVMPHNNDNSGKMDTAQGDLTWDVGEGFFKSVKVGGRWSKRTERDLDNGYAWSALGQGWNGSPVVSFADGRAGDYETHVFKNFFRGDVQLPGTQYFPAQDFIRNTSVQGFFDLYGGAPGRTPGFILPNDQTDFSTKTLAGYAMVNFGTNWGESELSGNAGVRVVNVKNDSTGYFQQTSTQFSRNGAIFTLANAAEIRDDGAEYTRVLPAVNLTYAPADAIKIRAAYNITMDNASFYDLRASGTLGVNTLSGSGNGAPDTFANYTTTSGDPTLKPTMSNNFDLSLEWYPKPGTTLHVAGFYKRIKDLVVFGAAQRQVTVQFADGTSEQALATTNDAHTSDETATVKGIELGGRTFLDQLPGWLAGIGVEANYTFIDSKNPGDLYFDIDGVQRNNVPLKGLSKHNLNAAFLYEKDPFSLRIAYSWRSKYLQSTTASGTNNTYTYVDASGTSKSVATNLPVYGASYGTLDAGLTLRVNEHFNVQLQAQNILNATQKTLMGGNPGGELYGRSWFQSDRRYRMGINVTF
ncbi:TonB-dependent receptor [Novosphingobium sp. PhB57]|uniref:TonB-dependent receptor n=1 Tax=unclassified Novosphingobium TaxID=2644732 RepID=UPI0010515AD5|nr:TonB-dependent receptor [Novosphingobium sp. PhB57]TCU58165.1 TonB-dependent receptor [Novosphingobium sp. PhB57]